jgi:signal transduction histidine kinase
MMDLSVKSVESATGVLGQPQSEDGIAAAISISESSQVLEDTAPPEAADARFTADSTVYFSLDAKGFVQSIGTSGALRLGYDPAELISYPVAPLLVAADQVKFQQHLSQFHTVKPPALAELVQDELVFVMKDGNHLPMQVSLQPLHSSRTEREILLSCQPSMQSQVVLYQQVQELTSVLEQQVEERTAALRQAYNFEATLKNITESVRVSLDESQILQNAVRELAQALNVMSCNTTLYDLEERTAMVWFEYAQLAPLKGRKLQMDSFPEYYNQLVSGVYFQFCSLLPNPDRGKTAMLACPILDDQGVLGDLWLVSSSEYTFTNQDIGLVQQVATQCAIALRQARLYQAAQAKVEELDKLNRLKDDFLSAVSHELRTPMANIKLATQMLEITLKQANLDGVDQTSLEKYFKILRHEYQREINLINDLLDLSRLEAGTKPPDLAEMNLQTWVPRLAEPFVERARTQQQQMRFDIPVDLPPLVSDGFFLERILGELLNNACKYTPAGEVISLSARVKEPNRALAVSKGSPSSEGPVIFQLSVSNSGVEISAEELHRVFDKFYRIPNNDPWKHGGTGLGLALVKKMVETLGGSIEVSCQSQVTCFTIELPLPEEADPEEPDPTAP